MEVNRDLQEKISDLKNKSRIEKEDKLDNRRLSQDQRHKLEDRYKKKFLQLAPEELSDMEWLTIPLNQMSFSSFNFWCRVNEANTACKDHAVISCALSFMNMPYKCS